MYQIFSQISQSKTLREVSTREKNNDVERIKEIRVFKDSEEVKNRGGSRQYTGNPLLVEPIAQAHQIIPGSGVRESASHENSRKSLCFTVFSVLPRGDV